MEDIQNEPRDHQVYVACLAEQAERFDDMVEAMNSVAKMGVELNAEERNLLSVGYKNVLGARRASWRMLKGIEFKEEKNGNMQNVKLIKESMKKVEDELTVKCNEILSTIDHYLLPSSNGEASVFYLKMKGDYYRYLAEFKSFEEQQEDVYQSKKAYEAATAIAISDLPPTNPIRLGLALNFSVFYFEIAGDSERAVSLAKTAFDAAAACAAELRRQDEAAYKNSTLIMRLIRDNLALWIPAVIADTEDKDVKASDTAGEHTEAGHTAGEHIEAGDKAGEQNQAGHTAGEDSEAGHTEGEDSEASHTAGEDSEAGHKAGEDIKAGYGEP